MNERFIFLDIDGILNCKPYCDANPHKYDPLDPECIGNLKQIIDNTEAEVVLSSTWNSLVDAPKDSDTGKQYQYLIDTLAEYGIHIWETMKDCQGIRPEAIAAFLERHPNADWVSLDDDFTPGDYLIAGLDPCRLVQTLYWCEKISQGGLREGHVKQAVRIFEKGPEKTWMPHAAAINSLREALAENDSLTAQERDAVASAIKILQDHDAKEAREWKQLGKLRASLMTGLPKATDGLKNVIWSDEDAGSDDEILELIREFPDDCLGRDIYSLREQCCEQCSTWMDDEIGNLEFHWKALNGSAPLDILILADIRHWNGRKNGYRILENTDFKNIFQAVSDDTTSVYCQDGEMRARSSHHDGQNTYVIRRILPDCLDLVKETILLLIERDGGERSEKLLETYTESLYPLAADLYGWKD